MDSLSKRPALAPKPTIQPRPKQVFTPPIPKKREELFISRAEAQQMEEYEKKFQKGISIKKIFWATISILFTIVLILTAYFLWKTYTISKKMNSESNTKTTLAQDMQALASPIIPASDIPLKGQESGRINILLLGAAGEHKPGGNLTDTIMVMSLNTETKKVALLSLPRDFYVSIPNTKSYTKINSLYPIGIKQSLGADLIKSSVEKITGLTLNYYIAVDFDGFQKIIDDIGGVNITSSRDIYDASYPGPNYSYQTFSLSKGFHNLDGATTLKYVRERHDDPQGDFGRALRQQQVIQAAKNKMFSMQTFFNVVTLNNVLDTLGDNIKTDIAVGDIESFIKLSKTLDLQNISNVVVDAWKTDSLLKVSHVQVGPVSAFILIPRVGNYSEIQDLSKNIFDQNEIKKRQALIASEDASIGIINKSGNAELANKIRRLLSDRLDLKNVHLILNTNNDVADSTTVFQKDGNQKIFTLDELIKKIPARIAEQNVAEGSTKPLDTGMQQSNSVDDFVITLGSDIVDIYKYDEASIDDFNKAQDTQDNIDFTKVI